MLDDIPMPSLLMDAQVLTWSTGRMLVLVHHRIALEMIAHDGCLVLRQPQLKVRPIDSLAPVAGETRSVLASLPCSGEIFQDTPEATLLRAHQILAAHARLTVVFAALVWDAVLRQDPTPPTHLGDPVRCTLVQDDVRTQIRVMINNGTQPNDTFLVQDPILVRASLFTTQIIRDQSWGHYEDPQMNDRLFNVPRKPPTGHANLEHQQRLQEYRVELEHGILPVLEGPP